MKDMYSFCTSEEEHNAFYEKSKVAYMNIYKRVGLGHLTYMVFASGGMFSKYSHEFQTVTSVGEDLIYVDENKGVAINKEVLNDEVLESLQIKREDLVEQKAIEVGNIFTYGKRYSEPLDLNFTNENGENVPVFMGAYGIGLGRIMGTVVEVLSDDKGIIWPESIAPFRVHLLSIGNKDEVKKEAEELYNKLLEKNIDVLFDDREASAGEKFADSDLIGIPLRVVVSDRSLSDGGYEVKKRTEEKGEIVKKETILEIFSK